MIGFSILSNLFNNVLQTKFVTGIYHSVKIRSDKTGSKPAAPVGGSYKYIGPDDSKGFTCYCRQTGSADVNTVEKIGGCNSKKLRLQVPYRLVLFNAAEKRDHETIIAAVTKAVIKTSLVKLQKIIVIPEEILRSEVPAGRFNFKENTLYFAIEFFVLLDLQADTCEEEIKCEGVQNPFCI